MEKILVVPKGRFATQDADAVKKKRAELAARLRENQSVKVTRKGEIVEPNDPKALHGETLDAPEGKLASGYIWYEKDPQLLAAEKEVMGKFFPGFQLDRLEDGRLCWIGNLNPRGSNGGVWNLMAIYDNNHPHSNSFGGSLKVYSIEPDLNELFEAAGELPHVLRDGNGELYLCTARHQDINTSQGQASAATTLGWAAKWIFVVEEWLEGDGIIGDEAKEHVY